MDRLIPSKAKPLSGRAWTHYLSDGGTGCPHGRMAKADNSPIIYPFIVIAVETSMRTMEILSIRRENVDLQRHVIFVPKAKAGAREQPITKRLADFLAGYIAALPPGTPWLFPSPGAASGHAMDKLQARLKFAS